MESTVPLILGKVIFGIVSTIIGKSRTPEEMEWAVDNSAITDDYKSRWFRAWLILKVFSNLNDSVIVPWAEALEESLLVFNIQNTAF